jgi:hypothetical protein
MNDDSAGRDLTPKQSRFCLAIVEGDGQSEAYRGAYDASAMANEAVATEASRLMRDPRIKARVDELRRNLQRSLGLSRATLLRELEEVQALARQSGDLKTMLAATAAKTRLLGFHDHVAKPTSPSQREAIAAFGIFELDGGTE